MNSGEISSPFSFKVNPRRSFIIWEAQAARCAEAPPEQQHCTAALGGFLGTLLYNSNRIYASESILPVIIRHSKIVQHLNS